MRPCVLLYCRRLARAWAIPTTNSRPSPWKVVNVQCVTNVFQSLSLCLSFVQSCLKARGLAVTCIIMQDDKQEKIWPQLEIIPFLKPYQKYGHFFLSVNTRVKLKNQLLFLLRLHWERVWWCERNLPWHQCLALWSHHIHLCLSCKITVLLCCTISREWGD